jgi:hypothetical protein
VTSAKSGAMAQNLVLPLVPAIQNNGYRAAFAICSGSLVWSHAMTCRFGSKPTRCAFREDTPSKPRSPAGGLPPSAG